jgi:molybdate transport system ATP-binding protein
MMEIDVEKNLGAFRLHVTYRSAAQVMALFGQSGTGKTTLIRMIGGLLRPDRGRIALQGRTLFDSDRRINVPPHRRRLGHVFQQGHLFPHMSVRGNLLYSKRFGGAHVKSPDREAGILGFDGVIELLGLAPLLDRRPRSLSGGEQQRVSIGRALLSNPVYLLMDEPLASLDTQRKQEIMPYFERVCSEAGVPILYVSHSVDEVARLAEEMVLLSDGQMAAHGSVTELLSRLDLWPRVEQREAGAVIRARAVERNADYELTFLDIGTQRIVIPRADLEVGAEVRLRIRARDVSLATRRPRAVSVQNVLAGRVAELQRESGPYLDVRVDVGGVVLTARITRYAGDALRLRVGARVYALVKSVALDDQPGSGGNRLF